MGERMGGNSGVPAFFFTVPSGLSGLLCDFPVAWPSAVFFFGLHVSRSSSNVNLRGESIGGTRCFPEVSAFGGSVLRDAEL